MSQRRTSQPGLKIYLISGFLSNAPMMFLVFFLTFLEQKLVSDHLLLFQVLFFVVMFSGAALSAFFVARRFVERSQILGLVTGSVGYAIYAMYSLLFYADYMVLGGFWPIVAFISGGVSGAQLSRLVNAQKLR